jgi:hypothetical protein
MPGYYITGLAAGNSTEAKEVQLLLDKQIPKLFRVFPFEILDLV